MFATAGSTSRTAVGLLVALTFFAHLATRVPEADAAELCWTGSADNEFTTAANWKLKNEATCSLSAGVVAAPPGPGDVAEFSQGGTLTIQVTAPVGAAVGLIRSRLNTLILQGDPLILDGVVDATSGANLLVQTVGANVTIGNDVVLALDSGVSSASGVIETVQTLGATTLALNGAISGPTGLSLELKPQDATTITLGGANTYAGGTLIEAENTQGMVRAASDTAFGTGTVTFNRGVLLIDTAAVPNAIEAGNSGVEIRPEVSEVTLSGSISCGVGGCDSGALNFRNGTSSCSGDPCTRVILSGDNHAYGGAISVGSLVALNVRHSNALGDTANDTTLNLNATLEIEGGITLAEPVDVGAANGSATLRSVSGDNILDGSVTGAPRVVAEVVAGKLTVNGSWRVNFNKTGAGVLSLEASNATNLSEMAVSAGTLLVNDTIGGSALLGVAAGATLGGSGPIYANASIAGTLAPGSSVGTLRIRGNVTFQPGATFEVEIDGATGDALEILGSSSISRTVTLDGALSVSATDPVPGTYPILVTGQNVSLTGTFVDRPEGSTVEGFVLTYAGGDGNNVVLTLPACGGDPCETPPGECYETQGSCNPATNQCDYTPLAAGTACTDDGNVCTVDQCDGTGQCAHPAGNAGTECRPVMGDCDVAESCTGTSPDCPADGFLPATTVCRLSAGDCDPAETCTGAGPSCPLDAKSTSICRPAATPTECDVAEYCDGVSNDCPADAYQPLGTPCSDDDVCTQTDTCDGLGACDGSDPVTCQALDQCHDAGVCDPQTGCSNPPKPQGTACNDGTSCTQNDVCDGLGTCAGTTFTCPEPTACQQSVACDGAGGCIVANQPEGATCTEGGQTGLCDGAGTCIVNQAPTADAGQDQQITYTTVLPTVQLDGCSSSDDGLPGGPLSFAWEQVAGTSVTLSDPSICNPSFTAPSLAADSYDVLTFVLTVSDGELSATDSVNVQVSNTNRPPTCNAPADLGVAEGTPVTLDGSSSFDPDGDPLTLTWLQISGPEVVFNAEGGLISFGAPYLDGGDPNATEELVFELTASDGALSSSCTTTVTVENVNHCPTAEAGPDQTVQTGDLVTLDGSGSSDPDADSLTFAWAQTAGPTVSLNGADSASATFVAPAAGASGVDLVFELTVDDGYGCGDTQAVTIHVSGAGEPPSCDNARASRRVLWPPNHKLTAVKVVNVATGDLPATVTVDGVTQDEPVDGVADGHTSPDAVLLGEKVLLRRERAGEGNGRVYHLRFTATNAAGSCTGTVEVCVPHSLRVACWLRPWKRGSCEDEGELYDSTQGSGL